MISNLGKAITILAKAEALELDMHADVEAFYAPSECHDLVARGEIQRARLARKHAEAIANRPYRVIKREAYRRGGVAIHYMSRAYGRLLGACLTHPYLTGRGL